jgi:hypothetical protein
VTFKQINSWQKHGLFKKRITQQGIRMTTEKKWWVFRADTGWERPSRRNYAMNRLQGETINAKGDKGSDRTTGGHDDELGTLAVRTGGHYNCRETLQSM